MDTLRVLSGDTLRVATVGVTPAAGPALRGKRTVERPQGVPYLVAIPVLVAALLACGCSPRLPRADDPADAEVTAAIRQAKATLDEFLTALASCSPAQSHFSLRVWLVSEDAEGDVKPARELAWLDDVTWDGVRFRGVLNREPAIVKGHARGDEVRVTRGAVADWLYIDSGRAVGGWTIRLLRKRMTAGQREKFDEVTPYSFE